MSPVGFEPAIPASERLQNYAEDREATEIGIQNLLPTNNFNIIVAYLTFLFK